jgi:hypothetical protein
MRGLKTLTGTLKCARASHVHICQANKHGRNARSATAAGSRALRAAALARPCRAGRNVTIAMGLEAPYAQAAEEAAASGRLYGSRNSAAGLGILPMLNLAG